MIKKFKEYIKVNESLSYEDIDDQFLKLKEIYNCDVEYYFISSTKLFGFYPPTDRFGIFSKHINDDTVYLVRIFKDNQEHLKEIKNELEQIRTRIESQFKYNVGISDTYNIKYHSNLSKVAYLDSFAVDAGESEEGLIDYSMIIKKNR